MQVECNKLWGKVNISLRSMCRLEVDNLQIQSDVPFGFANLLFL